MKFWRKQSLLVKILVGAVLGIILGLILQEDAKYLQPIGDIFLAFLQFLIVPIVVATLLAGILQMGSVADLGRIGAKFFGYLIATSLLAATIGATVAMLIRPGQEVDLSALSAEETPDPEPYSAADTIVGWVPSNFFAAMAEGNMLPLIVGTIIIGVAVLLVGHDRVPQVFSLIEQGAEVVLKVTAMVIALSPYGIFALVTVLVGTTGTETMMAAVKFVVADYIAIIIVALLVYPAMLLLFARLNPITFYRNALPASVFAMSTASSSGTIPISTKVAEENLGASRSVYGFTVPFGATANMDGFAAALGVIAVLAADVAGVSITFGFIAEVVLLGLVLSLGAAGVRGAGIVMSAVLLQSLGLPMTILPLLAAIWPLIDIAHTGLNVTGDLNGTTVVAATSRELNRKVFNAPNSRQSAGRQDTPENRLEELTASKKW
ncbi:dicarboxylate/amino acid:cation symporter [Arthrobacter pigmenti]